MPFIQKRIIPCSNVVDLRNLRYIKGANLTNQGNPVAHSTATEPPTTIISYKNARKLHREQMRLGNTAYHCGAFIHTCIDDREFDGSREGIWAKLEKFLNMASHFGGIACIDFSTYADLPKPAMQWQYFKIRSVEYAAAARGIPVIVNARWGTRDTWEYSLYELPENSILSVGTVGSGLRRLENRPVFNAGLREIVQKKKPTCLVVIGSANHTSIQEAQTQGVRIVQFDADTARAYKNVGGANE